MLSLCSDNIEHFNSSHFANLKVVTNYNSTWSIYCEGVAAPAPPRIGPVKRVLPPSAPLRISSKMFKKKSPSKPAAARPLTPDSDIEEITIIEDDEPVAASRASDADSDVSLDF